MKMITVRTKKERETKGNLESSHFVFLVYVFSLIWVWGGDYYTSLTAHIATITTSTCTWADLEGRRCHASRSRQWEETSFTFAKAPMLPNGTIARGNRVTIEKKTASRKKKKSLYPKNQTKTKVFFWIWLWLWIFSSFWFGYLVWIFQAIFFGLVWILGLVWIGYETLILKQFSSSSFLIS